MRIERSIFKPRAKGGYRVENKADQAEMYLYDEISAFGITARQFIADLGGIKAKTINLHVNSPGGSVFDGLAIYNALQQHDAHIVAHVDGLAASIASVITMAADEIIMAENAFLMVHEPFSIVVGGAEEMRKEAELLDKVGGQIAGVFVKRSGASEEQVLDWMGAETWFTAAEALEAGLIDVVTPNNSKAKAKTHLFDLSAFANVPAALQGDREPPTERELERILRDAGCSRAEAKSILADGFQARQRDAGPEPEPKVEEPPAPEQPRDAAPEPMDDVTALLAAADICLSTSTACHVGVN